MTQESLYANDSDLTATQKLANALLDIAHEQNNMFTVSDLKDRAGTSHTPAYDFVSSLVKCGNAEAVSKQDRETVYELKIED